MGAIGWRKVGDEGDELCRVLDDVLGGVDALKAAIRRGERLEGEVDAKIDWKEVWCPELSRSLVDGTTPDLDGAKSALRRMKAAKRALNSILSSLDDTIKTIMDSIAQGSRAAGLASLPDEILAQILEFSHVRGPNRMTRPLYSAGALSSVCKRFLQVAIGLPVLWKDVSSQIPTSQLPVHVARCMNPNVHLEGHDRINDLLERIHPYHDWEELHFRFNCAQEAHKFFQLLGPQVQIPFNSLKRLCLINYGRSSEDSDEDDSSNPSMLRVDEETLASWEFPRLTHIELQNILPSLALQCSNVTHFELVFDMLDESILAWDPDALGNVLESMQKLAVLSVKFHGYIPFNHGNIHTKVNRLRLPCLTSLKVSLSRLPHLPIVAQFMDLIETGRLKTLDIHIGRRARRLSDVVPGDNGEWLTSIFTLRIPQSGVRSFSAVENFSLDVEPTHSLQPHFAHMFLALPSVRHLSLALPRELRVDLMHWDMLGGLRELRSVRIRDCTPPSNLPHYIKFFKGLSKYQRERFERLELVHSSTESSEGQTFEEYVGDKLIRTGP